MAVRCTAIYLDLQQEQMLTLNNVEVIYSDVIQVLRGVSLEVPDGKIVTLLGANGAGKEAASRSMGKILACLPLKRSSNWALCRC
jgi:ABC-type sugar transport system ATPase subunit